MHAYKAIHKSSQALTSADWEAFEAATANEWADIVRDPDKHGKWCAMNNATKAKAIAATATSDQLKRTATVGFTGNRGSSLDRAVLVSLDKMALFTRNYGPDGDVSRQTRVARRLAPSRGSTMEPLLLVWRRSTGVGAPRKIVAASSSFAQSFAMY